MYFVGIDIAKHHHEAAILDESGKVILKKLKFDRIKYVNSTLK